MKLELITPRDKPHWLGLRKGRMTSSPTAGALGMNAHQTPLEAWLAITGRDPFQGNKATLRGTLLEQPVLDYPTLTGEFTREPAAFVLHGNGWSADSADCLYNPGKGELYLGEGKTVAQGSAGAWGAEGTDEIPDHVLVQCYWHMGHWPETVGCKVPVLIGGYKFEFREYYVPRDDGMIGEIFDLAARFHRDYVVKDVPPPATAGDDKALAYLWPKHVPNKWLAPTDELERLTREYCAARELESQGKKLKERCRAELAFALKDAEGARGAGWQVTLKHQGEDSPKTDWEALARHLGATSGDIQQFTELSKGHRVIGARLVDPNSNKKGKAA